MSASTRTEPRSGERGFALIEVLVALVIVGVLLGSIGALVASSVRATQSLDHHLTLVEGARTVEAALPARGALALGSMTGRSNGYDWRVDVSPFFAGGIGAANSRWTPETVTISVHSSGGAVLRVKTVRLRPRTE